jgi:hypothetical protein
MKRKVFLRLLKKKVFLFFANLKITLPLPRIFTLTNKQSMEIIEKIEVLFAEFAKDAKAQAEKGNKAAGTRARVASLEIEKLMKEFRKVSLGK